MGISHYALIGYYKRKALNRRESCSLQGSLDQSCLATPEIFTVVHPAVFSKHVLREA